MGLENKRILITAGPTWVAIDRVRVISNIATGETGALLAERLMDLGAKVTLLLGPVPNVESPGSISSGSRSGSKVINAFGIEACCLNRKIRIIRFKFFAELRSKIKKELGSKKYNYVIHSSAVSDFAPRSKFKGKLDSRKSISLSLRPLPKIYKDIRRISPKAKLVIFKLGLGVSSNALIRQARQLMARCCADLAVANTLEKGGYRAYIINRKRILAIANNKKELTLKLVDILKRNI